MFHWIWSLSIGGDAKNLCALAVAQQQWADVTVLTRLPNPGVRAAELIARGIQVHSDCSNDARVEQVIGQPTPACLIMHRNGRADQVETDVLVAFRKRGVACFEFNTFGRDDPSTDSLFVGHFFPSRSCLVQYAERRGRAPLDLKEHWAPGYSVAIPDPISQDERIQARNELGIPADAFVSVRLLRPDLRKWDPLPVLAVQRALRAGIKAHLIIQAPPPQRRAWIKKCLGDAATILDPTDDAQQIRRTIAAGDCAVNYSHIGETFGLAMVECMVMGLPVLVNSTPKMDNAQIEICTHGKTGLVANSVEALSAALQLLAQQPEYAKQLGAHARQFVIDTFSVQYVEPRVRRALIDSLKPCGIPEPDSKGDIYILDEQWISASEQRLEEHYLADASRVKEMMDRARLRLLSWGDAMSYVKDMDPQAKRAVMARLKKLTLHRG